MDKLQLSQDGAQRLAMSGLHDSIVGCLVGSALGDAVGLYTEFLSGGMSAAAYPSRTLCSPQSRRRLPSAETRTEAVTASTRRVD